MDILDILESNANLYPGKLACGYIGKEGELSEQLTYQQLKLEVAAASGQLQARYQPDSRVIVLLPTEASFIRFFLASLHANLIAVPCPIGYSGHEVGLIPSAVAVAFGACLVERHITLDRAMWGSDQAASVEPGGFERLVKYIRVTEQSLGDGVKKVYESEIPSMKKLRRVNSQ